MNLLRTKSNIISYTVNKAMATDCYISVCGGDVVVNAPWYFSRKRIQTIIEEKTQWICEKLKEYQEQNNAYVDNGSICILGITYQVHLYYKNAKSPTINLNNRIATVVLPNKYKKMENSQILKILVEKLYDKIAEREIEIIMEKTRLLLGFAPEDYIIKRLENNQMATCLTDEKKIIINPDIVKLDKKAIEYAILHEFCHLKYKIHAKGFWKMIKTYMPDYEKYKNLAV